jgi:hypothetical protein
MPKVRLILEDENGSTIEQSYELPADLSNLDQIDEAVEQFRLQALPVLEKELLDKAQQTRVQQEKKTPSLAKRNRNADTENPTR